MFKTKKGFTLIELLAVIVILGLLALIVTPGVAKVIRNSKINTAKASVEGYVREIENAVALYMSDTGEYPESIEDLELDGKNINKIENPEVVFEDGEVEEVKVEIDGLYCKYKKGDGTGCSEESFYAYMKNSSNMGEIFGEINSKYGIGVFCLMNNECTEEEQQSMAANGSAINALASQMDMTYYGIARDKISSIEFTNQKPSGDGLDISLDNANNVLMYSNLKDGEYEIKIYSEKEIKFPSDSMAMFSQLVNLDKLILNNINTHEVTNMMGMFWKTGESSTVFTLDLGEKFDTRNVTDMFGMFNWTGASSTVFTLDLGEKFDTKNVTNMSYMFGTTGNSSSVFTLDLGEKFDTRNVTDMSGMFDNTGSSSEVFMLDLGDKFDTRNVTDMSWMFENTGDSNPNFTLDLSTFDTSKVTNMQYMFFDADTLKTIYVSDKWNTNAVTNSDSMFLGCESLPNYGGGVDKTNAHYGTGGYLTLKN